MNNFTKDELEGIHLAVREYVDEDPSWRNSNGCWDPIIEKLQSLIDNYCDEKIEWVSGVLYSENGLVVGHSFRFNGKALSIKSLPAGEFPPYNCVNLSIDDAHRIQIWLNEVLQNNNYPSTNACSEAIRKYHELED